MTIRQYFFPPAWCFGMFGTLFILPFSWVSNHPNWQSPIDVVTSPSQARRRCKVRGVIGAWWKIAGTNQAEQKGGCAATTLGPQVAQLVNDIWCSKYNMDYQWDCIYIYSYMTIKVWSWYMIIMICALVTTMIHPIHLFWQTLPIQGPNGMWQFPTKNHGFVEWGCEMYERGMGLL